jgi:serine protease Do
MQGSEQGIGMAISASLARRVVQDLVKNGRVIRGYLGVALGDLTAEGARRLRLAERRGAFILDVDQGSPADKAGLRREDVVTRIGEFPVDDAATFRVRTAGQVPGTVVLLTIIRNGKPMTVSATIGELPALLNLGAIVREIAGEDAHRWPGSPERLVLIDTVTPGSAAYRAGLHRMMRIAAVGDTPVVNRAQFEAEAAKYPPEAGLPLRIELPNGRGQRIVVGGTNPGRNR